LGREKEEEMRKLTYGLLAALIVCLGWVASFIIFNLKDDLSLAEDRYEQQSKLLQVQDGMLIDLAQTKDALIFENTELAANLAELEQEHYQSYQDMSSRLKEYDALFVDLSDRLTAEINKEPEVKVIEKVVTKEIPQELEDWGSAEELKTFLREHKEEVPIIGIAGEDGIVQIDGQCVGLTMSWRNYAAEHGKNLELAILTPEEYEYWFSRDIDLNHAVLLALVEKYKIYYIDPQTLKIIYSGYVP